MFIGAGFHPLVDMWRNMKHWWNVNTDREGQYTWSTIYLSAILPAVNPTWPTL